jgi:hypothetical protein
MSGNQVWKLISLWTYVSGNNMHEMTFLPEFFTGNAAFLLSPNLKKVANKILKAGL